MSRSLKAHKDCLDRIRLAIKRNGFHTQRAFAEEAGFSLATVKKFLSGKPVDFATFSELCQVLNLDWQTIIESESDHPIPPLPPQAQPQFVSANSRQDWGDAMDISVFYGRAAELETLSQWIAADHCRLVTILGMGGMGKTSLAVKLASQLQPEFDYLIWRSLRNAPPLQDLLTDLLQFFLNQAEINLPRSLISASFDHQLRSLISCLQDRRCLVILDNAESIFQACDRAGAYRPGYELYGQFFRTVGETAHSSCLLVTSREQPDGLTALAGENLPIRCFHLLGLLEADGRDWLQTKGTLTATDTEWTDLIKAYGGNPLALKMITAAVRDYFDGSISSFLSLGRQTPLLFDDIRQLLSQQFERLTPLEREVMYWLAINREPIAWQALQTDLATKVPLSNILQAISSLDHRSLLEKNKVQITQQPVIMDYLIGELTEQICEEIKSQRVNLLRRHALVKANAKDYIRHAQIRLILEPIIERLCADLSPISDLTNHLREILNHNRGKSPLEIGYLGGNILNLLRHLQGDLQGTDFSNLTLWQAYLQGLNLCNVSFAGSDLTNAVFNQPFGSIRTLAFSPEGHSLATGDTNREIWIWQTDLLSGDIGPHLLTLRGHENWVCSVAFSPDGQLLASGGADRAVKVWRVSTGECLHTLEGHTNWVMSVAFSPDGQLLASGSADRTVKLWRVNTDECLHTLIGHDHGVWSIAFSPEGDSLVSGSADRTLRVWDTRTGRHRQTLLGHQHGVWSVAFSPQGNYLASGSADQTIKLWDTDAYQCRQTLTEHSNWVWSVAFSPQGNYLASGSADQTVRLWEVETGQCLRVLSGHSNWVWSVAFSLHGDYLVSGSEDRTMRVST